MPDCSPAVIDAAHLAHQREWSGRTFGPGSRTLGVIDHIRKELDEIEADPADLGEWVDVIILGFDGAWRAGWQPQEVIDAIKAKQARNEARTWPDWRDLPDDQAIEHDRGDDGWLTRPTWDDYFLGIASSVARRADCTRARHGAVIVKDRRIVSTGYNGSPSGGASCLAGECPRGLISKTDLPPNSADYSNCHALHAEQNAIAYANRSDTIGATIYITGPPCDMCLKLIRAAGIERVTYGQNPTESVLTNPAKSVRASDDSGSDS